MYIPLEVNFIIDTLNKSGFEAFVVGGCVRDSIMQKTPKDFDIATSATPLEIKPLFNKTVDTGIKHGTITVVLNCKNFELTTYRIDGEYKDCRRPKEVFFTKKLEDDLVRRDFTINAIAYHKEIGYIDPYKGIQDIKDKYIRGVGNPSKRFQEDALRMLRAIRFSSQLGFKIEPNTYKALVENTHLISKISIERIRDEINKTFIGNFLYNSTLLIESDILEYISSDLNKYLKSHLKESIIYMQKLKNITDKLVILFKYLSPEEVIKFMRLLKYSNQEIKEVSILTKYIKYNIPSCTYDIRKIISQLGKELFTRLINIKKVLGYNISNIIDISKKIIENNDPLTIKDLNINGNLLKEHKICEGKQIGEVLDSLLDLVLKNPELNQEKILIDTAYTLVEM